MSVIEKPVVEAILQPEPKEEGPSDSWVMSFALSRSGFPVRVAVGGESACFVPSTLFKVPRFGVHLAKAMPVAEVMRVLIRLDKRQRGAMMTGPRVVSYREQLCLDGESQVVAIRRQFAPRKGVAREELVGVAWLISGPLEAIEPAKCVWRTARHVRRAEVRTGRISALHGMGGGGHEGRYFSGPRSRRRPVFDGCKRIFDICCAIFAILITLPLTIPVALFIKLYDRGPIFFAHRREGRDGKPFACLKFRTMVRDAEAQKQRLRAGNMVDGPQFKLASDPRVTPLGRFLRRSNIDELPQFINVLLGQMSVVGPRPSPFEENQLCPAWREARLSVKPGITGLWQVSRSRSRGPTDFQEWIFFDTQYVEKRSVALDVRILLLTMKELVGNGQ